MTGWAERAKAAIAQRGGTAKTDESISPKLLAVSSVPTKDIPLSEKRVSSVLTVSVPVDVDKNDSISATKEDPDCWCWPNSPAMNGREIGIFSIRLEHLRSLGLDKSAVCHHKADKVEPNLKESTAIKCSLQDTEAHGLKYSQTDLGGQERI